MYTKFAKFTNYIFHILQHFTAKLCNFTKFRMLFQDVVIFLPVSNLFQNFVLKVESPLLNTHELFAHLPATLVGSNCRLF